jgi:protocatechuate 3,4-dioxygenase beta subunit
VIGALLTITAAAAAIARRICRIVIQIGAGSSHRSSQTCGAAPVPCEHARGVFMHRTAMHAVLLAISIAAAALAAQAVHEAPANAPSTGRLAPATEPGGKLTVSGTVVGADGAPIAGASLYVYQTDREGYYGVKPASDNRNPRLKLYLRTDAAGAWSFQTVKPGSYPNSRVPAHIHFEVSAPGRAHRVFEIVFEGDPFVTERMRHDAAFSVKPIAEGGRVSERITLR